MIIWMELTKTFSKNVMKAIKDELNIQYAMKYLHTVSGCIII